jgi:hypothetical protein
MLDVEVQKVMQLSGGRRLANELNPGELSKVMRDNRVRVLCKIFQALGMLNRNGDLYPGIVKVVNHGARMLRENPPRVAC